MAIFKKPQKRGSKNNTKKKEAGKPETKLPEGVKKVEVKLSPKKIITWLAKWAENGKWCMEQRASDKNAKYYYLSQAKKHAKLLNIDKKEI